MTISIQEFYKTHRVDDNFDEVLYSEQYPETKDFYQPHCKANGIDEKHRLYFHCVMYGDKLFKDSLNLKRTTTTNPSTDMNKNIELIVLCHQSVSDTTIRHIPVWKRAGFTKISFVSPKDNPFNLANYDCYHIGKVGINSMEPDCVTRGLFAFTLAATKDVCAVFEYDTICWKEFLDQGIPQYGSLASGKIHQDLSGRFTSNWFTHTQYLGLGDTYKMIIPHFQGLIENHAGDRVVAEAINRAGVQMEQRSHFSCNTFGPIDIERAVELRKNGKLPVTHGVKSIEALERLDSIKV